MTGADGEPVTYARIRPVSGEMFGHKTCLEIANLYDMDNNEQPANARLIAAAPDLLDACQAMVAYDDLIEDDDGALMMHYADIIKMARAAIAKAKGEQP